MRFADEVREQGRGIAGALLVLGISFAYTMETWWLAARIPVVHLVAYVVVGLGLVFLVTQSVGFRDDDAEDSDPSGHVPVWEEFAEVVFQSLVAGYGMLFLLGVLGLDDPLPVVVRTGLVEVVPLAFGASLANELLSGDQEEIPERGFPWNLGVFALGAVFFAAPIAPTDEVSLLATQSSWLRLGGILVVSLVTTYTMLYELEFRGQSRRLENLSPWDAVGQTCVVYAVATTIALGLLVATGDILSDPVSTWVQETVVLGFPVSIGASGARVVVG